MYFGKKVKALREKQGWNRSQLAEKVGISHVMVGRYERDETAPSVDVAKKMADALGTTIDYLVGEGTNPVFDKKTLERLEDLQLLDKNKQHILFDLMDTYIRDAKSRLVYAS